jgi:hypothetical protein
LRSAFLFAALSVLAPVIACANDVLPHPRLDSVTPRLAMAQAGQSPIFVFRGADLTPTVNQSGQSQFYMNTHAWEFYQLELQVETDNGLQTSMLCSNAAGSFASGCTINSAGASLLEVQVNYLALPGWRDGLKLHATAHVTLPGGFNVKSNTLDVPFARSLGTPAVTAQSKTAFTADQKDWGLRLAAIGLDQTTNARIDGKSFIDGVTVTGAGGRGVFIMTVPASARSAGRHTVEVCTWSQELAGPGERAACSAPAAYSVTMIYHRLPGAAPPAPALRPTSPVPTVVTPHP